MRLQYFRAFIVLLAGLVALLATMKAQRDVTSSLVIVLVVIVIFYFIGTLFAEIFDKLSDSKIDNNLTIFSGESDEEEGAEDVHVSFDEEDAE